MGLPPKRSFCVSPSPSWFPTIGHERSPLYVHTLWQFPCHRYMVGDDNNHQRGRDCDRYDMLDMLQDSSTNDSPGTISKNKHLVVPKIARIPHLSVGVTHQTILIYVPTFFRQTVSEDQPPWPSQVRGFSTVSRHFGLVFTITWTFF